MTISKFIKSIWLLPSLAVLTLLLYWCLPYNSHFVESWYSQGVFIVYRWIWDYTVGLLPIGMIYFLVLIIVFLFLRPFFIYRLWREKLISFSKTSVRIVSIGIISFYWLWAFNYKRSDFRAVLSIERTTPKEEYIFEEYCRITDSLVVINYHLRRALLSSDTVNEVDLRSSLIKVYDKLDIPHAGRVRAIKLIPKGSLLHISTAGVYLPFVGAGHIDAGLHPITHPFTMMHEMSHGYGWTGEDACNFLALMASINSDNNRIRYSGYFGYWRYLRSQIYRIDKKRFEEYYRDIPDAVLSDYKDILSYSDRYKDILPRIRNIFYDNYLKSHGISSGLVSYSEIILLAYEWQEKHGSLMLD